MRGKEPTNKLEQLTAQLRKELRGPEYRIGDPFPSEYALMEKFKVSRLTVNKATTLLAAEGLLERKGRGAGTIVRRKSIYPSGFFAVFTNLKHLFPSQILEGISQCAMRYDYAAIPFTPDVSELMDCLNKLAFSDCKGVFSLNGLLPADFPKPVVYLDYPDKDPQYNSVACDNYDVAFRMMKKLLASGRKEIVVLTMPVMHRAAREAGFLDALKEAGVSCPEERLFRLSVKTFCDVEFIFQQMRKRWPKLDFIATDSDDLVFELLKVFRELHIEISSEIGLSGFGNLHGISDLYKIPTVDQHPWHMGEAAVRIMMDILKDGAPKKAIHVQIPSKLINI